MISRATCSSRASALRLCHRRDQDYRAASGGIALRYAAFMRNLRDAIDARIRERLDGDERAIATAPLTGRRDAIATPVNDAAAIIGLLRDRIRTFDELSDKWEVAVFMLPNPPDSMARRADLTGSLTGSGW